MEAFDGRVDCSGGHNACWPWRGSRDGHGYGLVYGGKRARKAHRLAYEAAKGPIPPDKIVRHTCDRPACCNPAHLLIGTHKDNMRDCIERGRFRPYGQYKKYSSKDFDYLELADSGKLTGSDMLGISVWGADV